MSKTKKVHRHSIHLDPQRHAIVKERAKHYPSKNRYFERCIDLESADGDQRKALEVGTIVMKTFQAMGVHPPKD